MAEESNWWDGFTDSVGELAGDLIDGGKSYFNSREAEANAERAANENATATQQARIAEQNRVGFALSQQQKQKYMMMGLAAVVVLVLLLKR